MFQLTLLFITSMFIPTVNMCIATVEPEPVTTTTPPTTSTTSTSTSTSTTTSTTTTTTSTTTTLAICNCAPIQTMISGTACPASVLPAGATQFAAMFVQNPADTTCNLGFSCNSYVVSNGIFCVPGPPAPFQQISCVMNAMGMYEWQIMVSTIPFTPPIATPITQLSCFM